ncbi:MAG: 5-formyltetrahydrofolate cyclo-ligase [Brevinematales bacterium]|nr:5-formyltetrahydrofolate cyclo-ligase [Brevinematales bacterium]
MNGVEGKTLLRQTFLAKREDLSPLLRDELSSRVREWLRDFLWGKEAFLGYWPIRGEVDILPLMEEWQKEGKRLFLPRVKGKEIEVVEVRDLSRDVARGRFGIPEPVGERAVEVPDVILVPGVVFDEMGFRIGYGGGFYDRFLSQQPAAETVGVAYRFQILPTLPHHDGDVAVESLVCEEGWIKRGKRRATSC